MSDVVAELRALLVEYEAVDPERYFAAEDRWDVKKKILERLFPSLPALLDVAEASIALVADEESQEGGWGPDVTMLVPLKEALTRFYGKSDA